MALVFRLANSISPLSTKSTRGIQNLRLSGIGKNPMIVSYLASQIVEAWHLAQSLKVLFIATMSIAALSALGIAIIMRVTSVNAGHANPMGHPATLVMPETLGWAAQHFGAVFILPAEL